MTQYCYLLSHQHLNLNVAFVITFVKCCVSKFVYFIVPCLHIKLVHFACFEAIFLLYLAINFNLSGLGGIDIVLEFLILLYFYLVVNFDFTLVLLIMIKLLF